MAKKLTKKDPYVLTVKQARALMEPHKEGGKLRVHCMDNPGFAMMGYNVDLKETMNRLKKLEQTEPDQIRLGGPNMQAVNHGICYWKNDETGYVFIKTNKEKLEAFHKEVGVKFPKK